MLFVWIGQLPISLLWHSQRTESIFPQRAENDARGKARVGTQGLKARFIGFETTKPLTRAHSGLVI